MIHLNERIDPTPELARRARTAESSVAPPSGRDDRLFLRQLQAGERAAFETLLAEYEVRLYRLALRFTGNASDAEELTQEIFVAVYRSIGSFKGHSALGTWIYRVGMNHCLEYRRKRRLEVTPYDEEHAVASTNWRDDPAQVAERTDLASHVEAALKELSPLHRDVVVLHQLQGLTYPEVAEILGVPIGTVKSRLSNAFRRLRDLLGSYVDQGSSSL